MTNHVSGRGLIVVYLLHTRLSRICPVRLGISSHPKLWSGGLKMDLQELMQGDMGQQITQFLSAQIHDRMCQEQKNKRRNFDILNRSVRKGAVLFTGSSLMEQFPICEMAASAGISEAIYNRGIGGTTTDDFLAHIGTVLLDLAPSKVFLNIGTNDMTDRVYGNDWMDHLELNYDEILQRIREALPKTQVYCMAYYPTNRHLPNGNDPWKKAMLKDRTPENIAACNARIAGLADRYGYHYIDVNNGLCDKRGEQKACFSIDGVHMYADAYAIVFRNLLPYL